MLPECVPSYRGFTGTIEKAGEDGTKFVSRGAYERTSDTTVRVTELPVGTWTESFKETLEAALTSNKLKSYSSNYTNVSVDFTMTFESKDSLDRAIESGASFEREWKLISNKLLNTTNMYLFDHEGRIRKYASVSDIVNAFVPVRKAFYEKRKAKQIEQIERDIALSAAKARFIEEVAEGTFDIRSMTHDVMIARFADAGYPRDELRGGGYEYLASMPMQSLNADRRRSLQETVKRLEVRLGELMSSTVEDVWERELTELETALREDMVARDTARAEQGASTSRATSKKKATTRKRPLASKIKSSA
jgi:DNA topoisomerase-2